MEQRLVIAIEKDGKTLANAYYHWSAYTRSAAELTSTICEGYFDLKDRYTQCGGSDIAFAVDLLQLTRAGANDIEEARIEADTSGRFDGIDFNHAIDRNEGLLCVTEEGIRDNESWAEGTVVIDIGNDIVIFDVVWLSELSWYLSEYRDELTCADDPDLPKCNFDFYRIPVDNFAEVFSVLEECPKGFVCGDEVVTYIE